MGAPMIRHLLRAGHDVWVWNRTRAKAQALAADGARVVDAPRDLLAHAQAVFLCVSDTHAVEDVVFGAGGLLAMPDAGAGGCAGSSIIPASRPRRRAHSPRARLDAASVGSMRPFRAAFQARRPAHSRLWPAEAPRTSPRSNPSYALMQRV